MEISVSILNSKDRIKDTIKLNNTSCDYIHVDVMDGKFVPPVNFTINEVLDIINKSNKKIDIHLMCNNPKEYIKELVDYNISYITFHEEINEDIEEIISILKKHNIKVGMSIKPNTKIDKLYKYLDKIDLILIMSVEPGYGGQTFIPNVLQKAKELKQIIKEKNLNIKLEIDGGVNDTNIDIINKSNIDISVVGSYITKSNDFEDKIKKLKY